MKVRIILLSMLATVVVVYVLLQKSDLTIPEQYITACTPATEQFASFADQQSFRDIHPIPKPYSDGEFKGKMITYPVSDGASANAYFVESDTKTDDYLFVIHEWWGLNDYVKKESDRLYAGLGNIHVIALDLYDGNVASTRDDARKFMQSVTTERATSIINGAKTYAGSKAKVFTIGWCFGGGWSLQTGIELGSQAAGTVMFYGMPEEDTERLNKLQCDVLGLFAANEGWITPEVVKKFEENMKSLGKNLTTKSYDAEHGFANPSNPRYDKEATKDAYGLVLDFIQSRR